jgi:RHS repeat-associated protein
LYLILPGQYFDNESGNYYNYHRDYNPVSGRYIQSDPLGIYGGLNLYAYAKNNPLSYYDNLGLFADCKILKEGPRRKVGSKIKNEVSNSTYTGLDYEVEPKKPGTSPQKPAPWDSKIPSPVCPSINAMVKVYKNYLVTREWDLYHVYETKVKYICVEWVNNECTVDGPFTTFPEVTKRDDQFVKHVNMMYSDRIFWFGFDISVDVCPKF